MRDTVSNETITVLINSIGNPQEPTRSQESLDTLEKWLVDPLLILEPDQRTMIENALRKYGRL